MLFNSYIFILAFLPIVWSLYFGLNRIKKYKCAEWMLVLASLFFYGYTNWRFCLLLIASIVVNYFFHRLLLELQNGRKIVLWIGILYNVGLLFYIKYFDFFLENVNALFHMNYAMKNIVLPLGISFYTFQQLSFVIDSYKKTTPKYNLADYALFVSFFPQLIAGPIVLHDEMIPQFKDEERKKVHANNMYEGVQYFVLGLSKKVLIADTFGRAVDWGYLHVMELNRLSAVFLVLGYTLQIYFDFSGYCDMAKGLGKMFNFEIAMNFNSPYKAKSVSEFWDRWHMTLTRFFTTYLYIPFGGSRKGLARTCINVFLVFFISGFWHGADWTFVLWGVMHGVMMVLERLLGKYLKRLPGWFGWLYTFGFVNFAWVFFRADFFRQALSVFKRILLGGGGGLAKEMAQEFPGNMALIWILLTAIILCVKNTHEIVEQKITKRRYVYILALLMLLSFVSMSDVSKFLYFNF